VPVTESTATVGDVGTTAVTARRPSIDDRQRRSDFLDTEDVLVFERTATGFTLVGGRGRGEGWAGVVELEDGDETAVARAWHGSSPIRIAAEVPVPICGPYYASHVVAVAVGDSHVVIFGSLDPISASDSDVLHAAATAVDRLGGTPTERLLADELEVVHALRALMAYRPETVDDTIRHVATVAARALSCELAMIRVEHGGMSGTQVLEVRSGRLLPADADSIRYLDAAARSGAVTVEQRAPAPPNPFDADVAARMTVPIGGEHPIGAMVLAHRLDAPRGFTSLCQRIGRTVGEAAELLVTQAAARELLSAERDVLARLSGTDPLTGLANRRAWAERSAQSLTGVPEAGYVIAGDLDGLKQANDRCGHACGDELIRAAAGLLRSSVRAGDLVARIGGDEFAILLRGADATAARRVMARIRRAETNLPSAGDGERVRLSLGAARIRRGDLELALLEADRRMYADKRRRGPTRSADVPAGA
jgi:diguanylate cyclase (GGDEF)-like protein